MSTSLTLSELLPELESAVSPVFVKPGEKTLSRIAQPNDQAFTVSVRTARLSQDGNEPTAPVSDEAFVKAQRANVERIRASQREAAQRLEETVQSLAETFRPPIQNQREQLATHSPDPFVIDLQAKTPPQSVIAKKIREQVAEAQEERKKQVKEEFPPERLNAKAQEFPPNRLNDPVKINTEPAPKESSNEDKEKKQRTVEHAEQKAPPDFTVRHAVQAYQNTLTDPTDTSSEHDLVA